MCTSLLSTRTAGVNSPPCACYILTSRLPLAYPRRHVRLRLGGLKKGSNVGTCPPPPPHAKPFSRPLSRGTSSSLLQCLAVLCFPQCTSSPQALSRAIYGPLPENHTRGRRRRGTTRKSLALLCTAASAAPEHGFKNIIMNKPPRQTSTARGGGSSGDRKQAEVRDRELLRRATRFGSSSQRESATGPSSLLRLVPTRTRIITNHAAK